MIGNELKTLDDDKVMYYCVYVIKNSSFLSSKKIKLLDKFDTYERAKYFAIKEGRKRCQTMTFKIIIPKEYINPLLMVIDYGDWNNTYLGIIKE